MSLRSGALGSQDFEQVACKRVVDIADRYHRSRSSRCSPFIDLRCGAMHAGRGRSDAVLRLEDIGHSGRMAKEAPTRIRTGDRY
jgi:hypothetical protein